MYFDNNYIKLKLIRAIKSRIKNQNGFFANKIHTSFA